MNKKKIYNSLYFQTTIDVKKGKILISKERNNFSSNNYKKIHHYTQLHKRTKKKIYFQKNVSLTKNIKTIKKYTNSDIKSFLNIKRKKDHSKVENNATFQVIDKKQENDCINSNKETISDNWGKMIIDSENSLQYTKCNSDNTIILSNNENNSLENTPTEKNSSKETNDIFVSEYEEDLIKELICTEKRKQFNLDKIKHQNEINSEMRVILIDWIMEMHNKFCLSNRTLFLSIKILDYYLSSYEISRYNFQLLGLTSLFIACKFEETFVPQVSNLVFMTADAYTEKDLIKMELTLLKKLNYDLDFSTSLDWLNIIRYKYNFNDDIVKKITYLIEISLLDIEIIKFSAKEIIACAVLEIIKNDNKVPKETKNIFIKIANQNLLEQFNSIKYEIKTNMVKYPGIVKKYGSEFIEKQ